ncbi:prepilin peptidase [Methyloferula stellata]|uniref:prepilin peptidase n=1 Tax=Methyloferula stellata TaxID=876270 RepID=UPI0003A80E83|nr:A24 family peptidase [Methyloferula stellata]
MMADELSAPSLRPNFTVLIGGTGFAALLSFIYLPWPLAIASTWLNFLMIAGADVDARTFLLPDAVTYGAIVSGIVAAPLLDVVDPLRAIGLAILRAGGMGLLLILLRHSYARLRKTEGLGLGDVKLAAAVGAWLPVETIPMCFGLATTAALVFVLIRGRKQKLDELKLPFGAFLCPALWLVFFVTSLPR